jgi:uncharacterized membrane protein
MDQEISDNIIFFGRFHPLILHLPIGFLVIAFTLEALSRFHRFRQYKPAVGFVLLLGAASAVLAAALGYMLSLGGGYNEELLFIHQWSGIALASAAVISFLLYRKLQLFPSFRLDVIYLTLMALMMISLSVAGHFGGSLTHGSDYLTKYMPNGLRSIAGLPAKKSKGMQLITNLNEAIIFEDIIYPTLDSKCISCHNEDKRKGDLMMHTQEALLKGGENGPILIPGDAGESELIRRIHLPEIDEDHMPPDGKKQLTDEEVALLTWWINEDASFDKTVAEVNVDEEVQTTLNTLVDPDANKTEVEIMLAAGIKPVNEEEFAQLEHGWIELKPVSEDMNWLEAKLSEIPSDSDSLMQDLIDVAEQLIWLNFANTATTDNFIAKISQFKNLTRLHLQNTMVTDKGLQHLKNLPYLEYLNLYGTNVTDEGIQQLSSLKNLRKIFLWQTQVSKKGAAKLQEKIPGLTVDLGIGDWQKDTVQNFVLKKLKRLQVIRIMWQ